MLRPVRERVLIVTVWAVLTVGSLACWVAFVWGVSWAIGRFQGSW